MKTHRTRSPRAVLSPNRGNTFKALIPDAHPELPVMAYSLPAVPANPTRPRATARRKGTRKRHFNGLQLVINKDYRERLRACAQCQGMEPRLFLYHAVIHAIGEAERLFGASRDALAALSQDQRKRLARKLRAVSLAAWARSDAMN